MSTFKRWQALLLAATILAALAAGAVLLIPQPTAGVLDEAVLPPTVSGLNLMGKPLTGDLAIRHISDLHGLAIEVEDALIARYQGEDDRAAVIWVSQSPSAAAAEKLLVMMNEKMPRSPVFSDLEKLRHDGLVIYRVQGIGLDNYYFAQGNRVYWVGAKGVAKPLDLVRQLLQGLR